MGRRYPFLVCLHCAGLRPDAYTFVNSTSLIVKIDTEELSAGDALAAGAFYFYTTLIRNTTIHERNEYP